MRTVGVPYTEADIAKRHRGGQAQATAIAAKVQQEKGPPGLADKQVVALIAYVDRLGKDLFKTPPAPAAADQPKVAQGEAETQTK